MFEKIWLFIQAQMVGLQQSLEGALTRSGATAIGTGILMVIFWTYAAYKIYELWTAQADDTFIRKLFWAWKESRKAFVVYALMMAAPILVGTLGDVAKGYARKATKTVISSATPAFATVDSMVQDAKGLFNGLGAMLASNAGQTDLTRRTLWQGAKDFATTPGDELSSKEKSLLAEGGSAQNAAINFYRRGMDTQKAILAAAIASNRQDRIDAAQAAMRDYRKAAGEALDKASAAGAKVYVSNEARREARKKEIWAAVQARWYDEYTVGMSLPEGDPKRDTEGFWNWDYFSNGKEEPTYRRMHLTQQLNTTVEATLKAEEDRQAANNNWTGSIPEFGWRILGLVGAAVCMIAIIAAGVQIFKAAYGALMVCVGFVATITFGFALAAPVSPAFMLCFLSDKTEHWGRNFVSFILSAVFASMGLSLMVSGIGFLFRSITVVMLSQISLELLAVQAATVDLGEFIFAILRLGGIAMVSGMALTFAADLVKKGSAVGAGIFTGHFPA